MRRPLHRHLPSMLAALFLAFASPVAAQQRGADASVYTAAPVPDEEAVGVSVTSATPLSTPLVTVVSPSGDETSCILPCTFRSRVGPIHLEGERLAVDVDLAVAGLTYDVRLAPGPSDGDYAAVATILVTGVALLSLGAWAVTETNDEGLVTAAAFAIGYGGLAVAITLPGLIYMLATIDGTAEITDYRRGLVLTDRGPAFAF